jgi:predicted aldo/keto reductase-like oxidoreductase
MQYRAYGRLGIEVSALGFGAMRLPHLEDGTCDYDRGVPMLQRGIDLGINYIDTAWVYIHGTSEIAVGKAIKGRDRDKLYIATKIPVDNEGDYKAGAWRAKVEESLARLDTDYIDFLHFHNVSWAQFDRWANTPGMAMEAALQARDEGLARHLCFSSHDTTENVINLIETGEFSGMTVQYNYLDRHNEPAIARAAEMGMGVTVMGPLAGGRLATPRGVLVDAEGSLEMKTPELALRFVWSNPHVSVALSGMNEVSQIEENVSSASRVATLSETERAQVQRLIEQNRRLADLYCTGCGYCMPCPNGVNIPENFRYMNWYRVWGMEEEAKEAYAKLTEEGTWQPWAGRIEGLKAEECIQCGQCEPKCPQNISIIEQLEEVTATLGG